MTFREVIRQMLDDVNTIDTIQKKSILTSVDGKKQISESLARIRKTLIEIQDKLEADNGEAQS